MSEKALKSNEVTEPGAYEWINAKGLRHIGFLTKDRHGEIGGAFVAEDGHTHALRLRYSDGSVCEGVFYGPLPARHLAGASNA